MIDTEKLRELWEMRKTAQDNFLYEGYVSASVSIASEMGKVLDELDRLYKIEQAALEVLQDTCGVCKEAFNRGSVAPDCHSRSICGYLPLKKALGVGE